jgi:branched-chain amino acid transport system permease protein
MRQRLLLAAVVAAWVILPLLLSRHYVELLVFSGIYAIAGLGVGLLLGQCGIVNLAQAVFYAIGAYATANMTSVLKLPSVTGFVVGALVSMLVAVLVGLPVLRLRGFFLALATLALSIISVVLFLEWGWLTGAALGMGGIPKLKFGGWAFDTPFRYYYLVWAIALGCFLLAHNITHSRTGLMLRAMRDSEQAAESLAIRLPALRLRMFVLCALFGSLAGSLFAHYVGYVSFQSFTLEKSVDFLLIPVLGGSRSTPGVALGALCITFAPEVLSKAGGSVHHILFGLLLVLIVVLLPGGLVSLPNAVNQRRRGWASDSVPPAPVHPARSEA